MFLPCMVCCVQRTGASQTLSFLLTRSLALGNLLLSYKVCCVQGKPGSCLQTLPYSGNLFLHHVALLGAENGAGFAREFQLLKEKSSDGELELTLGESRSREDHVEFAMVITSVFAELLVFTTIYIYICIICYSRLSLLPFRLRTSSRPPLSSYCDRLYLPYTGTYSTRHLLS
jgi:hypothetical protein